MLSVLQDNIGVFELPLTNRLKRLLFKGVKTMLWELTDVVTGVVAFICVLLYLIPSVLFLYFGVHKIYIHMDQTQWKKKYLFFYIAKMVLQASGHIWYMATNDLLVGLISMFLNLIIGFYGIIVLYSYYKAAQIYMCMVMREVQKINSKTVTSTMLGVFRDDPKTKEEFLSLVHSK